MSSSSSLSTDEIEIMYKNDWSRTIMSLITSNPFETRFDFNSLSVYPRLIWSTINQTLTALPWNIELMSSAVFVTWKIVTENPQINWSPYWLGLNPNITLDIVLNNPSIDWNPISISMNPNITWEIVKNNPTYPWNYWGLSTNENIDMTHVTEAPNHPWSYCALTSKFPEKLTLKYIEENMYDTNGKRRQWDMEYISNKVTWEQYLAHPNLPWDISELSANSNITWDIVVSNPSIEWDYQSLSWNKNISLAIILENPQYFWDMNAIVTDDMNNDILSVETFQETMEYSVSKCSTIIGFKDSFEEEYKQYIECRKNHALQFAAIHVELIDILHDYDNLWYFGNLVDNGDEYLNHLKYVQEFAP